MSRPVLQPSAAHPITVEPTGDAWWSAWGTRWSPIPGTR